MLSQRQDLHTHATAHLTQTMSYLVLPTADLEARLMKELQENPALELVDEAHCPECGRRLIQRPCPHCVTLSSNNEAIVYVSPRERGHAWEPDESDAEPQEFSAPERLDEHILRQIGPSLEVAERPLAAYILARLDENGLLPETVFDIVSYTHFTPGQVQRVLYLIQHAEPPGVGCHTRQESFLAQLDCLAENGPLEIIELARVLVRDHYERLTRLDYVYLARQLRVPRAAVVAAAAFIKANLVPHPARSFWGEGKLPVGTDSVVLQNPDVNIALAPRSQAGSLLVEVFAPLSGWLRVSPEFKAALAQCEPEDREKWSSAVEHAALITKCLQQRNHTMRRLMEILATVQREFILGGDANLKPLTRARIAATLGVHESTVSRAVSGKCASLPDGRIIPLDKFFDRSLPVRDRVRALIESETRPLTDDEIAEALAAEGIQIARRTVAKYRNMLGILPAHLRARLTHARPAVRVPAAAHV